MTRPPAPASTLLLTLTLLTALGCRSVPTTHFYTLHAPAVVTPGSPSHTDATAASGLHVEVASFLVDPPYDRGQLVYRVGTDSAEVGFYIYHQWAAPLSRMLPVLVAEGLQGTPGLASIRPAASVAVAVSDAQHARLDGRLVYLEEIDTPAGVTTRVRLDLLLTRADGVRLWQSTVHGESQGPADSVAEVVDQMRDAVGQALEQARSGLQAAL